jgi:hypothetical protein
MSERKPFLKTSIDDFTTYGHELLEVIYQGCIDGETVYHAYNESYLNQLEEEVFSSDGCLGEMEEELSAKAALFFAKLHQQWETLPTLGQKLIQKFGATIPHDWLQSIAHQAQEFVTAELSGVEELVNCVQPLLAQWSNQDLQVFARPIAVAMRGQSPELLENIPAWENLSPVQQARYTLAIAHYALGELKKD